MRDHLLCSCRGVSQDSDYYITEQWVVNADFEAAHLHFKVKRINEYFRSINETFIAWKLFMYTHIPYSTKNDMPVGVYHTQMTYSVIMEII